ncbi:hypothetical protein E4T39_00570 [Aureobasidium subglaciale]|nr:hypothetical protein E4T39_00570 [Aureobasidium subglaciale]
MRRRRASISSSSDQPWWQNSSDSQRAAGSALTASLVVAPSSGTGQRYTTIYLTRTQYTTYIYSNSPSSRSSRTAIVRPPSPSHSMSRSSSRLTSGSSWSALFTYQPTTFSTTTTARVTTHLTTTVRTIVYITSTRTVPAESSAATTGATTAVQTTAATTSTTATSSTSGAVGAGGSSNGDGGTRGPSLVSPDGSSKHSAAIAGGMTGSLAGIALIGLLFLFFIRRRKRRIPYQEKDAVSGEPRMSSSSQALPYSLAASRTTRLSDRNRDRDNPDSHRTGADRLPVIDHNLIHIDVGHWDRPYVHEDPHVRDNGSPLRLMNPDPTPTPPIVFRSSSSSLSPDTAPDNSHGFLQRQRSALTAAILSIKRSFSSQDVTHRHASDESYSQPSIHPSAHPSPLYIQNKNTNMLTMPFEAILAGIPDSRPMSSQSAMSNNTIIRHKAPDDPFVTSTSATPDSPLPNCLKPGNGTACRDFLAPPPLRTRIPIQSSPTPRHGAVSPLTRSNSDCSTRFESLSPTRSDVSSVSVRSGPFDLATASVVDGESGRQNPTPSRGQREQTPNWEVHVFPGT